MTHDLRSAASKVVMPMEKDRLLASVAQRSQLREGTAGVEEVLRAVYRAQHLAGAEPLTARALARLVRLPLPVVTAVRRELEKAGVLDPGPYLRLTNLADQAMSDEWGWATLQEMSLVPSRPADRAQALCFAPRAAGWGSRRLAAFGLLFWKRSNGISIATRRVDVALDQKSLYARNQLAPRSPHVRGWSSGGQRRADTGR